MYDEDNRFEVCITIFNENFDSPTKARPWKMSTSSQGKLFNDSHSANEEPEMPQNE
jgi:hypothetical protein